MRRHCEWLFGATVHAANLLRCSRTPEARHLGGDVELKRRDLRAGKKRRALGGQCGNHDDVASAVEDNTCLAGCGGQVLAKGLLLLAGTARVQELLLRDLVGLGNTSIVGASVADPYVLLHLSSGNAVLLQANQEEGTLHAALLTALCQDKCLS